MTPSFALRFCALTVVLVGGCSVINSFDPLLGVQTPDAGAGTGAQSGASGSGASGQSGASGSSATSGNGGTAGEAGASGGMGGTGGVVVAPPGLIVGAGYDDDSSTNPDPNLKDQLLVVLSPQTGAELARDVLERKTAANGMVENGTYVAIGYDGVRDVWYLFKNTSSKISPPGPTDTATLELRRFDRDTNSWTMLSSAPVAVPAPASDNLAILRERVAYLAYDVKEGGPPGLEFVVIDTTTPAVPVQAPQSPFPLAGTVMGLLGTIGSGVGGTVSVLRNTNCVMPQCDLTLRRMTVQAATIAEDSTETTVASYAYPIGGPAWTSNIADDLDVIAYPVPGSAFGKVAQRTPASHALSGAEVTFPTNATRFGQVAFDPCNELAFPIELVTTSSSTVPSVYAVPMTAGGTIASQTLLGNQVGQHVLFEPYTRTVLAPFRSGAAFAFPAYAVQGTATMPSLKHRIADWKPPADFAPIVTTVAQPNPIICQ